MFFWLLIALILIWALAIPAWPYHRRYDYGYYPFGAISAILLIFVLLWWIGLIAVTWPERASMTAWTFSGAPGALGSTS